MSGERGRADLGFGAAFEDVDAAEWVVPPKAWREAGVDTEIVKELAERSGFQSRESGRNPIRAKRKVIARMQKNFRPRIENCEKFDFLASLMVTGKEGPELIDEALELLFRKYKGDMELFEALKVRRNRKDPAGRAPR